MSVARRACLAAVLACGSIASHAGDARANGRFPSAEQLVVAPSDPARIAVQVTYGFLQSFDAGQTWDWTCEQAAFYGGVLDPPIGIMGDGKLIAGVFDGLTVSSPDACNYALAEGATATRFVVDVSVDKMDPSQAIAVSSNGIGGNKFVTKLHRTTDQAATWNEVGPGLPDSFLALTCDSAPTDPTRIYVSGYDVVASNDYRGAVARSEDGGMTWVVERVPGSTSGSAPYLAAVSPLDPDTIFVRLASDQGTLLASLDAGATYAPIFQGTGKLLAFALSPDGTEIFVGGESDGIWAGPANGTAFEQRSTLHARCLTHAGADVYACAREGLDGFTIGRSRDGARTFDSIYHLPCLRGPVQCGDDSDIVEKCTAPWTVTRQELKVDTCPAAATTGTGGGEGGQGGGGPTTGDDDGDCGCSVGASDTPAWARCAILFAALLAWARRSARR